MKSKGFTLIELLIVVAIIAILAAIAVPNFLEAQTRAKITRNVSDFRTVATGLETYRVDHNKYPADGIDPWQHLGATSVQFGPAHLSNMISTPIAYISDAQPEDVFKQDQATKINRTYRYLCFSQSYKESPVAARRAAWPNYVTYIGEVEWMMFGNGPDRSASVPAGPGAPFYVPQVYDATNGTISRGDIIRTNTQSQFSLLRPV